MSLRNFIIGLLHASLLGGVLLLGGCTSLSKDQIDNAMIDQLASVEIVPVSGRNGQIFNQSLRQTMFSSYGAEARYRLSSSISVSSSETFAVRGVSSDFKKMTMSVSFTLTDIGTNEVAFKNAVTANATLGTVSSKYGLEQSELQAKKRLAKLLAERVRRRLQLYFLSIAQSTDNT
ncbi:MAG: LPS assembly lipoprotein LptE [Candidatus Puniceispirillum sp.]